MQVTVPIVFLLLVGWLWLAILSKLTTTRVLVLIAPMFIFGVLVKPLYLFWGSFGYLANTFSLAQYESGLLYEVAFFFLFSLGYIAFEAVIHKNDHPTLKSYLGERMLFDTTAFCVSLSLLGSFYVAGVELFAVNRTVGPSMAFPILRYIYPFFYFGQITLFPYVLHCLMKRKYDFRFLIGSALILVIFVVMNQRGMLVTFILFYIACLLINNSISLSRAVAYLSGFVLIVVNLKYFVFFLSGTENISFSFLERVFNGPDASQLQVWPIVFNYLNEYGPTYGATILASFLGVIPHTLRYAWEINTATDLLNGYYSFDDYYLKGFGFNGTLLHDLFMSFGWLSLLIAPLLGILFGRYTRWFRDNVRSARYVPALISFFLVGSILGSGFQTVHWYLVPMFYIVVSFMIFRLLSTYKLRLK